MTGPGEGWERWERWLSPVLVKDLLTAAAAPANGARRVPYALLLALPLAAFAWAVVFTAGEWRFATRPVFLLVCALLAFVHLPVAVSAATAFSLERDRSTLEGLLVSPLTPWRLVLGKLSAALAIGLLTRATLLPALGVAYALGGGDAGLAVRYLALVTATDVSLAAFAMSVGARHHDVGSQPAWIKNQTTQTQLALQATLGLTIGAALVPCYAIVFLVPLAARHGHAVATVLDALAPLGAIHPLATLVLWGEVDLLGVRVPLWAAAATVHLLIALPLLAQTVEVQRVAGGAAPSRLPRLFALPALGALAVGVGSIAGRADVLPEAVRGLFGVGFAALAVMIACSQTAFGRDRPDAAPTWRDVAVGLWPPRALESSPARAPAFLLLVGGVVAPVVLVVAPGAPGGWTVIGLAVTGASLAAAGLRLSARARAREDEALRAVLEGPPGAAAADDAADDDDDDGGQGPRRPLATFLALITAIPAIGLAGLALAPALGAEASGPLWRALTAAGLIVHPLTATLPALADPSALPLGLASALERGGLPGWQVLFGAHVLFYAAFGLGCVASLPRKLDLDALLRSRRGAP